MAVVEKLNKKEGKIKMKNEDFEKMKEFVLKLTFNATESLRAKTKHLFELDGKVYEMDPSYIHFFEPEPRFGQAKTGIFYKDWIKQGYQINSTCRKEFVEEKKGSHERERYDVLIGDRTWSHYEGIETPEYVYIFVRKQKLLPNLREKQKLLTE